jgi:hypothetical protein
LKSKAYPAKIDFYIVMQMTEIERKQIVDAFYSSSADVNKFWVDIESH